MAQLPPDAEKLPDFRVTVEQAIGGVADADGFVRGSKWLSSTLLDFLGKALQLVFSVWGWAVANVLRLVAVGVEHADPAFGEIAKAAIQALFGVNVAASSLLRMSDTGGREEMKREVGQAMLKAMTGMAGDGSGGSTEPSIAPAEKYLGTIANFAIEGWLIGIMVEAESAGWIKEFGELKDVIASTFGFGRLTRRILNPAITTLISDPMARAINKIYRPNLLAAGEVTRQVARGRWSVEQAREELARQGWSDMRIEALLNATAKFHSISDLTLFVRNGFWTQEQAQQHLRDQGYTDGLAVEELVAEDMRLEESYALQQADAAADGYVAGRITETELRGVLADTGVSSIHRARIHDLAVLRREMRRKSLSSSEVEQCVKKGVLSVVDYRRALEREGYDPEAVIALELLLRVELDAARDVAAHRAEQDAQRAAEQAARAAAAEARRQQVEADQALRRRGPISDLERAVVRGLIPFARLEEVLSADYDADTVGILVALVETDRQAYLDQQQRAEEARQRAARRGISLSDAEQGVLAGVLTLDQYRQRLTFEEIPPADAAILADTLAARLADAQRAKAARDAAELAARNRQIDLSRFEQLVRRGVRTIAQYDALLVSLGFGDAARADLVELLKLTIADDAAAVAARADAEPTLQARGLSVDQFRRSVILGLKSDDDYQRFLQDQGFTADVQVLLLTEVRADVAEADTARQRREEAARSVDGRAIPLSTLARAARLGIVAPATYQQRLLGAGYSADDVAIEMQLLLVEIADVQAARAKRDDVERDLVGRGLSLSELARAVRRGLQPLDAYQTRAAELGLSKEATDTLVRILADELRETTAAKARRDAIGSDLAKRNLSLAELEAKVVSGVWTIADYTAALEETGFELDDAELLGFLLVDELEAAGAAA